MCPGADGNADAGDRTYLVLAKPNVIMNDIRVRGLAVAFETPEFDRHIDTLTAE